MSRCYFYGYQYPKKDPRNTRLFHIACTTTGTNKFPDSTYKQAHMKPKVKRGIKTSFLA